MKVRVLYSALWLGCCFLPGATCLEKHQEINNKVTTTTTCSFTHLKEQGIQTFVWPGVCELLGPLGPGTRKRKLGDWLSTLAPSGQLQ